MGEVTDTAQLAPNYSNSVAGNSRINNHKIIIQTAFRKFLASPVEMWSTDGIADLLR